MEKRKVRIVSCMEQCNLNEGTLEQFNLSIFQEILEFVPQGYHGLVQCCEELAKDFERSKKNVDECLSNADFTAKEPRPENSQRKKYRWEGRPFLEIWKGRTKEQIKEIDGKWNTGYYDFNADSHRPEEDGYYRIYQINEYTPDGDQPAVLPKLRETNNLVHTEFRNYVAIEQDLKILLELRDNFKTVMKEYNETKEAPKPYTIGGVSYTREKRFEEFELSAEPEGMAYDYAYCILEDYKDVGIDVLVGCTHEHFDGMLCPHQTDSIQEDFGFPGPWKAAFCPDETIWSDNGKITGYESNPNPWWPAMESKMKPFCKKYFQSMLCCNASNDEYMRPTPMFVLGRTYSGNWVGLLGKAIVT